jgi:MFS family permease
MNKPTADAVQHLVSTRRDAMTRLLITRALRDFGDGFVAVLLPVYLKALGFSLVQIGLIATAALLGSALLTLVIGIVGTRYDHRQLLILAAGLMIATGAAFSVVHDFGFLLLVAFAGTANPSVGSVSIFVPLEHAVLSGAVSDAERTKVFSRYSFVGAFAGALGSLAAATPDFLGGLGLSQISAIRWMFILYALLGLIGGSIYARIPRQTPAKDQINRAVLGPSRGIVYKLAMLFSLDAFAGGFVVQSLLALWLFERFGMSLSQASFFFFWSGVLSAFSFPVAAWLARHVGLINTMVWTHIPSSMCLILTAVAPNLAIALILLSIRAALSQMDVPTRSSYVMAVVSEAERAAAASFTSVPRSLASAASPALAGVLLASSFRGWPLIICGGLKIVYDILLLIQFKHVRPPEER